MDYSLPAWLGALAGTAIAAAAYVPVIRIIDRHLRGLSGVTTPEERAEFERRLSIIRRVILGIDIAILATLGYWIGGAIGGSDVSAPLR